MEYPQKEDKEGERGKPGKIPGPFGSYPIPYMSFLFYPKLKPFANHGKWLRIGCNTLQNIRNLDVFTPNNFNNLFHTLDSVPRHQ